MCKKEFLTLKNKYKTARINLLLLFISNITIITVKNVSFILLLNNFGSILSVRLTSKHDEHIANQVNSIATYSVAFASFIV